MSEEGTPRVVRSETRIATQAETAAMFERLHKDDLLDPETWIRAAVNLMAAVDVLRPRVRSYWKLVRLSIRTLDREIDPPASTAIIQAHNLLLAYAFEDLFKAYLIKKNYNDYLNGWGKGKKLLPLPPITSWSHWRSCAVFP